MNIVEKVLHIAKKSFGDPRLDAMIRNLIKSGPEKHKKLIDFLMYQGYDERNIPVRMSYGIVNVRRMDDQTYQCKKCRRSFFWAILKDNATLPICKYNDIFLSHLVKCSNRMFYRKSKTL